MSKKIKEIGGLSRKAKFNIFIVVFLVFLVLSALLSLNQIMNIIRNNEKIRELQEKLNYEREKNIKLLAEEKALYSKEAVELEARKQFNMTKSGEINYFIDLDKNSTQNKSNVKVSEDVFNSLDTTSSSSLKYKEDDLWENIKIFYETEIKNK